MERGGGREKESIRLLKGRDRRSQKRKKTQFPSLFQLCSFSLLTSRVAVSITSEARVDVAAPRESASSRAATSDETRGRMIALSFSFFLSKERGNEISS